MRLGRMVESARRAGNCDRPAVELNAGNVFG